MKSVQKFLLKNGHIIIIALVLLLAVKDLFHSGLLPTHDGEYHIIRFYEFDKVLRSGVLYPRWAPDLNNAYGVPLFNYVYPLPNYIASLLHVFSISFIDGFKLSMVLATILSAIGMYLFSKLYFGKWGGVLSAVFYIFAPYRFVDIYVRGSIGEVWALTFLPFLALFITRGVDEKKYHYFWFAGIILSLLIFSHNILAVMFTGFTIVYSFFLIWQRKAWKCWKGLLLVFLISFGISAIFWLPALLEEKYVQGLQVYDVSANFPELYQLLIPSWGSGFSSGSLENQMSFQIGIANLLVTLFAVYIILRFKKNTLKNTLIFFLISFVITCFFLLRPSEIFWKILPFFNYFQFPWRFLSLIIFLCSFLAGALVLYKRKVILIFFGILAVLLSYSYAKAPFYFKRDDQYYISRDNFIHGTNSPGNTFNTIWMNRQLQKTQEQGVLSLQKEVNFEAFRKYSIPIAYFPGWLVKIDGKDTPVSPDKNGLLSVPPSLGKHLLSVSLSLTAIQLIASIITLLSITVLILLCFQKNLSKIVSR